MWHFQDGGLKRGLSVVGRPVTISKMRAEIFELADRTRGLVTIHPSFLLRIEDHADKQAQYRHFVADLQLGAKALGPEH